MRGARRAEPPCVLSAPLFFCGGLTSTLWPLPMDRAGTCCKFSRYGAWLNPETIVYITWLNKVYLNCIWKRQSGCRASCCPFQYDYCFPWRIDAWYWRGNSREVPTERLLRQTGVGDRDRCPPVDVETTPALLWIGWKLEKNELNKL